MKKLITIVVVLAMLMTMVSTTAFATVALLYCRKKKNRLIPLVR